MDKIIVTALNAAVEANERTKVIADAIAKIADIDWESTEKTVREAVDTVMDGYELTLARKQEKMKNKYIYLVKLCY